MKTIQFEGQDVPVHQIGRGCHSTVYQSNLNSIDIFFRTITDNPFDDNVDWGKRILCTLQGKSHIPVMRELSTKMKGGIEHTIYYSNWYAPLLGETAPEAYRQWKIIKQIQEDLWLKHWQDVGNGKRYPIELVGMMTERIEEEDVPQSLKDTMYQLYSWGSSYNNDLLLDVRKCNYRVDTEGVLLFTDPMFDQVVFWKAMERKMAIQRQRIRGY